MPDTDSSSAIFKSHAKKLAALMAAGAEGQRVWHAGELAAIFRHQMSTPMRIDLGMFNQQIATRIAQLSEAQGLVLKSFADLFHHPAPPIELLLLVKDFAKANLDPAESGVPNEISTALYYTSIAAALVRLNERISTLADEDMRRGLQWSIQQPWLDPKTTELLNTALEKLSPSGKGGAR